MPKKYISNKKLKAIVFTDIVNFTQLSAKDEQYALELIDKQREILKPIVEKRSGEWLKEIGDGLLFSFDSSLEAVRCSIEIQKSLRDIEDLNLRIGIHQGDIFIKDGDVFGDDVNIASRIEGFAPIGGISISDKVYRDISSVKDIETGFIGYKELKGVEQETQIRCITSHNLPQIKSSRFISFIGYLSYLFGFINILLGVSSIVSYFSSLDSQSLDSTGELLVSSIVSVYLGLLIMVLGYNCFAYKKGLSKKSQRYVFIATYVLVLIIPLIAFILGFIVGALR
tara:strand:- start:307 stop:1155 length:849 start_codon:yes stop_codon:yes gene_type:complete